MTQRAAIRLAVDFDEVRALGLRPSIKIAKAAAAMDVDISTIYKLIKRGSLESYRVGSEYRIFVDSIAAFQRDGDPAPARANPRRRKIAERKRVSPSHMEAMAYLDKVLR